MDFKKPTQAEAIIKLLAAIKLCKDAFSEDLPNFAEMLTEWEQVAKRLRHSLVHNKDGKS